MTPFNPDSWMDVVVLVVLALITTGGATLTTVVARRHGKTLGSIQDQVTNAHETNLRDDIDKLTALVAEGFAETRKDVRELREEMRTERIERIEGDRRGMRRLGLLDNDG
ncbi:MAG: DUF2746 domain-containing protein [Actinomycetia bacterium]|nr:DUF2746 domain-containing protein [Actinomycetes bacterium]